MYDEALFARPYYYYCEVSRVEFNSCLIIHIIYNIEYGGGVRGMS